ncbi:MAG: hypothetical protein KF773_27395 [Deltaproteobacteria bacterium]|nr:hypothetical protein [Deltaproteobacteria bacterium]MCW5803227.1 hypothetical protein [Deltaproteobacteria bacterium]
MKRLIGFLVLGGAVAVLVARRLLRHGAAAQPPADGPETRAHAHQALRERLARIPIPPRHAH